MVCSPGAGLSVARSSTSSAVGAFSATSGVLAPVKPAPSARSLSVVPENSPRQVSASGMVSFSPSLASQTLFSRGAMVMGAPSASVTEMGTSASKRGLGISPVASRTGQAIEASCTGRVTVAPLICARPKIFATPAERGAFSDAVMSSLPCDWPAGIFSAAAVTPAGKFSMPSSMSPAKPSRRMTTTSKAIVPPGRNAMGLDCALRSPLRSSKWMAHAARAKSGAAGRMTSR